jgi:localization factor PodJL
LDDEPLIVFEEFCGVRPPAAMVPANALLETAVPVALAAGASTVQAAPAAAEPVKNLLEEAKSGDAVAQFDVAVRYAEGDADERNYELAAQWYGKAAEQGLGGGIPARVPV